MENGCDHLIVRSETPTFDLAARELNGGRGVDVVFDGIGADTFVRSLDTLAPLGTMVTFGNASGPAPQLAPLELAKRGSISIVRPRLDDYILTEAAFRARAAEVLAWIAAGKVKLRIGGTWPLGALAEAHTALESGATSGKLIIRHRE
jgi:NADPH2:quinone reductase